MFSHWNECEIGIVVHNGSNTREISFDRIMFAVKHNSRCNRRKFIEEIQKKETKKKNKNRKLTSIYRYTILIQYTHMVAKYTQFLLCCCIAC